MLPLSLQTGNQGTSDSSLKCHERKKRDDKTGKSGPHLFWLAFGLQTIQCVVLKKFSREELTSFVNSVTLSDNHRVVV